MLSLFISVCVILVETGTCLIKVFCLHATGLSLAADAEPVHQKPTSHLFTFFLLGLGL